MRLSRLIVRQLPTELRHDPDAVDARLEAALADARRRWPTVELTPAVYLGWVAARIPPTAPSLEQALDGLCLADLYLACACAAGDPKALTAFELAFLAGDTRASDDVKQRLRQRLFVRDPGGAPARISLYAGRGDLSRWVRAAIARLTIDEARGAREIPTEDALIDAIGIDPGQSPELAHLKQDARSTLQAAIRDAVSKLSDRDRTLLLQHYIDGVGVAELGKLFDLAASNISRTLAKARLQLVAEIRRSLMRAKKIRGDELDSLVELVRSQLTLTSGLRKR